MTLRDRYTTVEKTFKDKNLNTDFISTIVKYYEKDIDAKTRGAEMKAVRLEPSYICRVIVLPMDYDLTIAQKLFRAACKVLEVIPSHLKVRSITNVHKMSFVCRFLRFQLNSSMLHCSMHPDQNHWHFQRMMQTWRIISRLRSRP